MVMLVGSAYGHGGGLDVSGCHADRKTGTRHCHGSPEPAPTPICPVLDGELYFEEGDSCWSRFEWDARCCALTGAEPPPDGDIFVPIGDVLHWSATEDTPEMCATVIDLSHCRDFPTPTPED
jgi:hypothetical protein